MNFVATYIFFEISYFFGKNFTFDSMFINKLS